MKKLSAVLAATVLFAGISFASPVRQDKDKKMDKKEKKEKKEKKAEKKEEKKADKK